MAYQVSKDRRVDGTGARPHHQALKWRESHGGVHAFSIANSAQGSAVAQMADNHAKRIAVQNFRGAARRILMAEPVESIAPNAECEPLVRSRINVRGRL